VTPDGNQPRALAVGCLLLAVVLNLFFRPTGLAAALCAAILVIALFM
jgi:hypothetical protein